jgi:O-acetyl-ADP-ribose deacetylase (regulator of RNase III)
VGPVWRDGSQGEDVLLRSAYKNSLKQADQNRVTSISFPSISTGAYRFPIDKAADIALSTCIEHLKGKTSITKVRFVLFGSAAMEVYQKSLLNACRENPEIKKL